MKRALLLCLVILVLPALAYEEVDTSSATATAWSQLSGWPPSNALDGDFNSAWSNNRTTHPTTDGAGDWFQVDWPSAVNVSYIYTEGRSYQGGFYSIPKDVRLHFSDASTLDFSFDDTTADHWVQEYVFDADQKTTDFVKIEFLSYWHHVWEYIQYYETDFYGLDAPPYVDTLDPADNDTGVDPATDIIFHAKDDVSGINTSTIDFTAEDENRLPGITVTVSSGGATSAGYGDNSVISGTLTIDDADINDVVCTFDPDSDLPPQEITCTVAGTLEDNAGNTMGSDFVWSFFVLGYDVDETTWGAIKADY